MMRWRLSCDVSAPSNQTTTAARRPSSNRRSDQLRPASVSTVFPLRPVSAMDSSVDMSPDEYKATGDHHSDGATSESREHNFIQDLVRKNRVVIFSKSHCPYCDDSKTLLNNMGVNYYAVELDQMKGGNQVQNVLGRITDARTVPRIFIDGHCVGGNSDLKSLNSSGALRNLLKDMHFSSNVS